MRWRLKLHVIVLLVLQSERCSEVGCVSKHHWFKSSTENATLTSPNESSEGFKCTRESRRHQALLSPDDNKTALSAHANSTGGLAGKPSNSVVVFTPPALPVQRCHPPRSGGDGPTPRRRPFSALRSAHLCCPFARSSSLTFLLVPPTSSYATECLPPQVVAGTWTSTSPPNHHSTAHHPYSAPLPHQYTGSPPLWPPPSPALPPRPKPAPPPPSHRTRGMALCTIDTACRWPSRVRGTSPPRALDQRASRAWGAKSSATGACR